MSRKLSNESSLENLKREAKRWLRALRENDAEALARLIRSVPGAASAPTLRDVQHALALEHAFDGWNALGEAVRDIEHARLERLRMVAIETDATEPAGTAGHEVLVQELLHAVDIGDTRSVESMLREFPEIINERGTLMLRSGLRTALHSAVSAPNADTMVRVLLEHGANPNIRDEEENAYPLHFAAELGNVVVLTLLIEAGAELNGLDDYHELGVIGWATVFGTGTGLAARELLQRGARHTLPSAVALGDSSAIRTLIAAGARIDVGIKPDRTNRKCSLLHLAVMKDQTESVETLVSLGADVNATDTSALTALDLAALDGKSAMAERLIAAGATITLPAAIALERLADAATLLHTDIHQLKPGHKYGALITQASERASANVIRLLLRCGADVNARTSDNAAIASAVGYTALHAAAFRGNLPAVEVLLEAGANVRAREERYCSTPAGWARRGKQHDVAARILEADVDIFDAAEFNMPERIRDIVRRDPGALRRPLGAYVRCVPTPSAMWNRPDLTPADAARDWRSVEAQAALQELLATSRTAHDELVARFLKNACRDPRVGGGREIPMALHTASRILQQHPEIARDNIYTAVTCGELDVVKELLNDDATLATRVGGPRDWSPLLYLANARLLQTHTAEQSVEIARLLLDRGADVNDYCPGGAAVTGYDENGTFYTVFTCVVGMGEPQVPAHPHARELCALLLERGAEPYDIQVLYNVFADHGSRQHLTNDIVWLLELIHERSVQLGREADWQNPSWDMLTVGSYGPGAYYLLSAALKKRLLPLAEWMLQHGAGPNTRASDPRFRKYSLYEQAFRVEDKATMHLLERYGADAVVDVAMSAYESFVQASLRGDFNHASEIFAMNPAWKHDPKALLTATRQDNANGVQFLLSLGVSPDIEEDRSRARALHAASFSGATNAARVLLEAGADPDFRELNYGATPMGVASWARQQGMTDLLAEYSRDLFSLVYAGKLSRVRAVLNEDSALAMSVHPRTGESLLMVLPDDEDDAVVLTELLLAHGADRSLRDSSGTTALDVAERRALPRVVALLQA